VFIARFTERAVVNEVGREFRSPAAIRAWNDREVFDAQVTLEVIDVADRGGETIVTTKVDSKFERTGLPYPAIINHHITAAGGKNFALTCRLAKTLTIYRHQAGTCEPIIISKVSLELLAGGP
jgi:hypothetical protein